MDDVEELPSFLASTALERAIVLSFWLRRWPKKFAGRNYDVRRLSRVMMKVLLKYYTIAAEMLYFLLN